MFQELKFQLSTAILTVITLAAGVAAFINFEAQLSFRLPDDGVIWVDRAAGVEALYVAPRGPGANAGVHVGDVLESIQNIPVAHSIEVAMLLASIRSWNHASYLLSRRGTEVPVTLVVGEVPLNRFVLYQYGVGCAYLLIGLFVYFRRGSAHKALHFYVLCLASFIFFCSHYTGQLAGFDKINLLRQRRDGAFCRRRVSPLHGDVSRTAALVPKDTRRNASLCSPRRCSSQLMSRFPWERSAPLSRSRN